MRTVTSTLPLCAFRPGSEGARAGVLASVVSLKGWLWQEAGLIGHHGPRASLAGCLLTAVVLMSGSSHLVQPSAPPCVRTYPSSGRRRRLEVPSSQLVPDLKAKALNKSGGWGSRPIITPGSTEAEKPWVTEANSLEYASMTFYHLPQASLSVRRAIRIHEIRSKWQKVCSAHAPYKQVKAKCSFYENCTLMHTSMVCSSHRFAG